MMMMIAVSSIIIIIIECMTVLDLFGLQDEAMLSKAHRLMYPEECDGGASLTGAVVCFQLLLSSNSY